MLNKIVFTKRTMVTTFFVLLIAAFLIFSKVFSEANSADNSLLSVFFHLKLAFLGASVSLTISMVLILVFRRKRIGELIEIFMQYRYYLFLLVKRDFVTKYKRSMLGVLWSLLNPLLTMLIMMFVFRYIFARDIPNYPVYLLSGFIIYNFFSESTNSSLNSIIGNSAIIGKIYVPKYIFPLSKCISSLINVPFSLVAFAIVFVTTKQPLYETSLLFFIPIIYTFLFATGVSMALSSTNVFFRDLNYLWGISLTLLTYLTPIFYPVTLLPEWVRKILAINPLYHFIDYFRNLTMYGIVPGLWENLVCISFVLMSLGIGLYVFMSKQNDFILYV